MSRPRCPAVAPSILALVCGAILTASAVAQGRDGTGVTDPNGHPFRMPTVSPLESIYRIGAIHVSRGDRSEWVALGDFGDRWSFWLRNRPEEDFELSGSFHLKAASRFELESLDNLFVEITFRVGGYLRARYGNVALRIEGYHESSHLGDEFLVENPRELISTSREGFDFLFQVSPASGLILFGGPGWIVRSALPFETMSFRAGSEWELSSDRWVRPYLGVDAYMWSELDWQPQVSAEAGVAIGRNARLGAHLGIGPSRAGQFFREEETLVGLMFSYRRQ